MHIIFKSILAIPRPAKRSILIAADSVLLIGALWLSFSLRLDNWYWPRGGVNNPIVLLVLFAPVFAVPVFAHFGLYRAIIRYLGMRAVWSIVKAVTVYAALWGLVAFLSGVEGVPRAVVLINAMVAVLAVGGSRMFARWLLRKIEDSVRIKHARGVLGVDAVVA
ncbi:MAG: FlaA1/EpsC-like NDP-sugar epimerase, partial [Flavobacteriaceae bacterium]